MRNPTAPVPVPFDPAVEERFDVDFTDTERAVIAKLITEADTMVEEARAQRRSAAAVAGLRMVSIWLAGLAEAGFWSLEAAREHPPVTTTGTR